MANIRVDLNHAPLDGEAVTFKAPCDASEITGLVIYYDGESKVFTLTDANGNDIGVLDNIFAEGAIVKAILDTDGNKAFVQNPNTNTYLETELAKKYSPTNKPTAADAGAAPAGYGLGGTGKLINSSNDLNAIRSGGIYYFHVESPPANAPSGLMNYAVYCVEVIPCHGTTTTQIIHINSETTERYSDSSLRRSSYGNTWLPWEWVNPPMFQGVEYRTTERYNGKAVYVKLFNIGVLPNATAIGVDYGVENISTIVRCYGFTTSGWALPTNNFASGSGMISFNPRPTKLYVKSDIDASPYSAYGFIAYTKTTD